MNALAVTAWKVASSKLQFDELTIDQKTRKAYRQDKLLAPSTQPPMPFLRCCARMHLKWVTREDISLYKLWEEDELEQR